MLFIKISVLLYVFVYYGILLGFRAYLLYKNTGVNVIKNMQREGLPGFIEKVFAVCFITISVIAFNYAFLPVNYQYLVPITYLEHHFLAWIGIVFSFTGLSFGFIAQLQMGDSWRLGINNGKRTELITKGLYQYSRNPVYLGIFISAVGFFLMVPSALSLSYLIVFYISLEVKIRLEELVMENTHANTYLSYKKQVRRWN